MRIQSTNNSLVNGVVGHRGASFKAPENTMAAFEQALLDGADSIELDVSLTKDGRYVVIHDDTVDRTTNGTGVVRDMDLDEIQKLDAGSWHNPRFAGEKAPELGEVLDWAKGKIHVLVEVKRKTAEESSGEELVQMVRQREMTDQVTIMSFNHQMVERVESLAPEIDTGVLCPPYDALKKAGVGAALGLVGGLAGGLAATGNPFVTLASGLAGTVTGALGGRYLGSHGARKAAENSNADALMPNWFITSGGLVKKANKNGKGVVPYTIDSKIRGHWLKLRGVDGLITNRPERFA